MDSGRSYHVGFACCLVGKVDVIRDAVRVSDETSAGFERWSSLANPPGPVDVFLGFHVRDA